MDDFPNSEVWRRWQKHMSDLIDQRDGIPVRDALVRMWRLSGPAKPQRSDSNLK